MGIAEEFREKLLQEKDRSGGGISAFEEMLGLKRSTINSIVSGGNTRIPSIEKAERIAHALGWEVYIGPPRTAPAALAARFSDTETLPVRGMAACSVRGWGKVQRESAAPAPAGPAASDAFWVIASGASMRPEGIEHCDWCLISTTAAPAPGDRVWIRAEDGASLKRLMDISAESLTLRGWLPPDESNAQHEFQDQRPRSSVTEIFPVIAVYPARPKAGAAPPGRPDPRSPATIPAARLANALGAPETSTPDQLIEQAKNLRKSAMPDKVREAAAILAAWHRENNDD